MNDKSTNPIFFCGVVGGGCVCWGGRGGGGVGGEYFKMSSDEILPSRLSIKACLFLKLEHLFDHLVLHLIVNSAAPDQTAPL